MEYQKYLLGNFGDNSWLLWEGIRLKYGLYNQSYFGLYGYINNSFITEPLTYYPYLFLSRFINAIDLWNAAIVILMFLNIFFSYRYFSKISNYKFVAVVISLVWVSNAYFSIHSRDHLSLMAGFLYPIYMLIYNSKTTFGVFKKYFFLLTSLLISNYIGIFLVFTNLFISLYTYIKEKNKINTLDFLISIFSTLSLSLTLKYFYQYAEKSVENFVIFSFKPWHLFIQPPRALINISDFEMLLPNNNMVFTYFENDHSTSYFGFTIIVIFLIQIFRKKIIKNINIFILILIFTISFTPTLTIKGFTAYFPSFIFYELFPYVRVTSRINIFAFLIILGILLESFKEDLKHGKNRYILCLISFFTVLEIFVPFKISHISDNKINKFLREESPENSKVIFYPEGISDYALKNMVYYQRQALNPRGYVNEDFSAEKFTKELNCSELEKYHISQENLYIITDSINIISEFRNNQEIKTENGLFLYKISCNYDK